MTKTIIKNRLIEVGEHIVLGVSGGPDSVCLLYVLKELSIEWQLTIHAVHVNHGLRGKEADEDQHYTESLCRMLDIPCHVFHYDVEGMAKKKKVTIEEAGRIARYEAFYKTKSQLEGCEAKGAVGLNAGSKSINVKIALAHNLNDQAETLLMRIIRGTGTDGLAGIEYVREGVIIRPLLDVNRDEIEGYCAAHNLNPRVDLTNLEPIYTRNRLRLELLPLLQSQYNENILSALNRLSQVAREDKEYLYEQVDKVNDITSYEKEICKIACKEYNSLHPAIGKRLILKSLKDMGMLQDMTAMHLDAADNLIRLGKTGGRIDFPGGYGLRLTYEHGILYKQKKGSGISDEEGILTDVEFAYHVLVDGVTQIPELNAQIKTRLIGLDQSTPKIPYTEQLKDKRFCVCLDISKKNIDLPMIMRTRRAGDYIVPLGMKGTKKLQDFFVDEKIPKEKRAKTALLCCGQEVLWVVGHRINENYKITDTTTEMLYIEYLSLI